MKFALLSNVNLDMVVQELKKKMDCFDVPGYGNWASYAVEKNNELASFNPSVIFVLLDGNSMIESSNNSNEWEKELDSCISLIQSLSDNYPNSIIVASTIDIRRNSIRESITYSEYPKLESNWHSALDALSAEKNNIAIFDLKELIMSKGTEMFYSSKLWYMGSIPYSMKAIRLLAKEITDFVDHLEETRKKVLVVDLDNTLWGGVIGEDGPEGIVLGESLLGACYRDAQKRIKEIADTGVLLVVVSKNNVSDVDLAFTNPHMVLKKEDFIYIISNWELKSSNIMKVAEDLNLGLSSFVFLDDNPVECEEVSLRLPDVSVSSFPKDIAELPSTINEIYNKYFWCWKGTKEDKEKKAQYISEINRKHDRVQYDSMNDYLLSLNIEIRMNEMNEEQIARVVQLINKTNQFNTNTLRFDLNGFKQYIECKNNRVFVANVTDKYGDSGLVAVVMIRCHGKNAVIDNYLMSCRVMGRSIENAIINAIMEKLYSEGIVELESSYVKTEKNKPVEYLYDKMCFSLISNIDNIKRYRISLPNKIASILNVKWME